MAKDNLIDRPFDEADRRAEAFSMFMCKEAGPIATEGAIALNLLFTAHVDMNLDFTPNALLSGAEAVERVAFEVFETEPELASILLGFAQAYDQLFQKNYGYQERMGA